MKLETLRIQDLVTDPNNARSHNEKNLDAIKGSLSRFGQRKPIVIGVDNVVVAGNGTLAAAKLLGWKEIAVVRVPEDWTAQQAEAFALADNRTAELAEWNQQVLSAQILSLSEAGIGVAEFGFDEIDSASMEELADAFNSLGKEKGDIEQITFSLHSDQAELIRQAIIASKELGEFGDTGNTNSNGNAITRICELWLGSNVG
jgi:ParB family transcriptional regulator, chromosome partitioning protein